MKLYAPSYYKKFKCIADKCEHNCCIGWEIDIDRKTLQKYKKLDSEYGKEIIKTVSLSGNPHFELTKDERCPHLDENGLCKIISNEGEEYLCDICKNHPRFYNYTDVAEAGLGLSCTEAARIVLSSPDYYIFEEIGTKRAKEIPLFFNGRKEREKLYKIVKNPEKSYEKRLESLCEICKSELKSDDEIREKLAALEYLDESHRELFLSYAGNRPKDKDEYLERFLAYFIYRHVTEAEDSADFSKRLAFCLTCERLFASLVFAKKAESLNEIAAVAAVISEEIEYSEENTVALIYNC